MEQGDFYQTKPTRKNAARRIAARKDAASPGSRWPTRTARVYLSSQALGFGAVVGAVESGAVKFDVVKSGVVKSGALTAPQ